ncbi:MAG: hypothetical protein B6V02_03860 [Thermoprotei archaeon ex4572_64]|nr:MAG: hypothetical protein B6V02_03860 [Thermoprotei archaeon ex4572_64]
MALDRLIAEITILVSTIVLACLTLNSILSIHSLLSMSSTVQNVNVEIPNCIIVCTKSSCTLYVTILNDNDYEVIVKNMLYISNDKYVVIREIMNQVLEPHEMRYVSYTNIENKGRVVITVCDVNATNCNILNKICDVYYVE